MANIFNFVHPFVSASTMQLSHVILCFSVKINKWVIIYLLYLPKQSTRFEIWFFECSLNVVL